jgi:hypothetical protein
MPSGLLLDYAVIRQQIVAVGRGEVRTRSVDLDVCGLEVQGEGGRGLGRGPGHFAKTIIREILGLAFFDSLQN